MKIRLRDPLRDALRALTQTVDPATGVTRRIESLPTLKLRVPLEDVVSQCLEQEPDNPGATTLVFHCFMHDDEHPSMWVDTDEQRWGCRSGCTIGPERYSSGDVFDFIQEFFHLTRQDAFAWVRMWDYNHNHSEDTRRIRIRLPHQNLGRIRIRVRRRGRR